MDIEELLKICEKRNVEIIWRYDHTTDSFIIRARRGNYCVERTLFCEDCYNTAFGLTIRIILRNMIDEIDEATGGKNNVKKEKM